MTVDVRCLPYMPLHIERLRRSKAWLRCKRRPELAFYIMNLWMRAWHEVPAGSIEADDDVLADAAMCSPDEWERIRSDVLQGWEEREGRWHHHVVTELAAEGMQKVEASRRRTEAARQARQQNRVTSAASSVTEEVTIDVADDVAETKEKKKGREEVSDADASDALGRRKVSDTASIPPPGGMDHEPLSGFDQRGFQQFWDRYPHRVGKQDALKAFLVIGKRGAVTLDVMLAALERYIRTKPPDRAWCNPATWLRQGRWDDEPSIDDGFRGSGGGSPRGPIGAGKLIAAMGDLVSGRADTGPPAAIAREVRIDGGPAPGGAGDVLPFGRSFGGGVR